MKVGSILWVVLLSSAGCISPADQENLPVNPTTVDYRFTGIEDIGGATESDYRLRYELQNGILTAYREEYMVFKAGVDLTSGLVDWMQQRQPDSAQPAVRNRWAYANSSIGSPLVGMYVWATPYFFLNPIPPPQWLDAENSHAVLGKRLPLERQGERTTLRPCTPCREIRLNSTETWVVDHPIFPKTHQLRVLGREYLLERLTPLDRLPTWPRTVAPEPLELPPGDRREWHAYPPLGEGELASELGSFISAVDEKEATIDLRAGDDYVFMLEGWISPRYLPLLDPLWQAPTINARVSIDEASGKVFTFTGQRLMADLPDGFRPWSVTEGARDESLLFNPIPVRPPLLAVGETARRLNVTLASEFLVAGVPNAADEDPAFTYVLSGVTCLDKGSRTWIYSLWSGELLLETSSDFAC